MSCDDFVLFFDGEDSESENDSQKLKIQESGAEDVKVSQDWNSKRNKPIVTGTQKKRKQNKRKKELQKHGIDLSDTSNEDSENVDTNTSANFINTSHQYLPVDTNAKEQPFPDHWKKLWINRKDSSSISLPSSSIGSIGSLSTDNDLPKDDYNVDGREAIINCVSIDSLTLSDNDFEENADIIPVSSSEVVLSQSGLASDDTEEELLEQAPPKPRSPLIVNTQLYDEESALPDSDASENELPAATPTVKPRQVIDDSSLFDLDESFDFQIFDNKPKTPQERPSRKLTIKKMTLTGKETARKKNVSPGKKASPVVEPATKCLLGKRKRNHSASVADFDISPPAAKKAKLDKARDDKRRKLLEQGRKFILSDDEDSSEELLILSDESFSDEEKTAPIIIEKHSPPKPTVKRAKTEISPRKKTTTKARASSSATKKRVKKTSVSPPTSRHARRKQEVGEIPKKSPPLSRNTTTRKEQLNNSPTKLASHKQLQTVTEPISEDACNSEDVISFPRSLAKLVKAKRHDKKLFDGFSFLFSGVDVDIDDDTIEFCSIFQTVDGFNLLKKLVQLHGGQICNTYSPANHHRRPHKQHSELSASVLICTKTKRTEKYLMSVIYGTPILHFKWIVDCCVKQTIIDFEDNPEYQLPAGFSEIENQPIYLWELFADTKFQYPPNIFDGMRVEVVGQPDFRTNWTKILRAGGAKVVNRLGFEELESKGRGVEVVISDLPVKDWVRARANLETCKFPICSSDYVVNCLLHRSPAIDKKKFVI